MLLPLCDSVNVLCFVVRYFVSILVLQSSWWGGESWMLCLVCLPCVSLLLCGSSSRYHGFVCRLWLWYFLIVLACHFNHFSLYCFFIIFDKYFQLHVCYERGLKMSLPWKGCLWYPISLLICLKSIPYQWKEIDKYHQIPESFVSPYPLKY